MQPLSTVGMKLVTEQEIEDLKKQASNSQLISFKIKCFIYAYFVISLPLSLSLYSFSKCLFLHLQFELIAFLYT